jgi:hypothetical protein
MTALASAVKKPAGLGSCLASLAYLGLLPFLTALGSIYDGWLAVKFWTWFVTPYNEMPAPPILLFIGLDYIVALLFKTRIQPSGQNKSWGEVTSELIASLVVWPTLVWVAAYLAHRWIG